MSPPAGGERNYTNRSRFEWNILSLNSGCWSCLPLGCSTTVVAPPGKIDLCCNTWCSTVNRDTWHARHIYITGSACGDRVGARVSGSCMLSLVCVHLIAFRVAAGMFWRFACCSGGSCLAVVHQHDGLSGGWDCVQLMKQPSLWPWVDLFWLFWRSRKIVVLCFELNSWIVRPLEPHFRKKVFIQQNLFSFFCALPSTLRGLCGLAGPF